MKYCEICSCNVSDNHANCPLCGSYLMKEGKGFERYEQELEPLANYPKVILEEKIDFLRTKNNYIMLLLAALCVVLNILMTPGSLWSAYAVIGVVFAILCVMLPIANRSKIYIQIMFDLPVVTVLTLAVELTVKRMGGVAVSVMYVLPGIYAAALVLTDAMIIATAKQRTTGYFTALLISTIFAILPQLLTWTYFYKLGYNSIVAFIVFFFALINLGVILIVSYRKLKEEYGKKMNI